MKNLSLILISIILATCISVDARTETLEKANSATPQFNIESPAFANGAYIPPVYTCSGADYSPALLWTAPPEGTISYAMIVDDPDTPVGTFTHWVVFNIPATQVYLEEKASPNGALPNGTLEGKNDFGKIGYGGPCPPPGKTHRYFFKLYALDAMLTLPTGASKEKLVQTMRNHILGQAQMIGLFAR